MAHLGKDELEAGLDNILASPAEAGTVDLIVGRPDFDERQVMDEGELTVEDGLVGDNWLARGSGSTPDGSAHPDMQLNVMNSRCVDLVAQSKDRWALAGDQLFVDLDLSIENLPAGTQLSLGSAIIEVTAEVHSGCAKFSGRFGVEALRFVNSKAGRKLRLRGLCARVVQPGSVRPGDVIKKL